MYKSNKKIREEEQALEGLPPRKKKALGQHFLRKSSVVDHMIDTVTIAPDVSVVEIGCGDGFLTSAILRQTNCKNLIVYEIDPEWVEFVQNKIKDNRLVIKNENILDVDFQPELVAKKPLVLLANLPYQITFPILFKIQKNKELFQEGVVMAQEEVAQKIVATHGKKYSPTSMFLQRHFEWRLIEKVEPEAFVPPPKVFSRTIYFKPKFDLPEIPQETAFWKFLKLCFISPRQTLKNNLRTTEYYSNKVFSPELLALRAQQISFEEFVDLWKQIIV
jgi:16S rRNA (adenine1518-N6/adenine1519-N6)-dimethyltransferase